ncbi:MAG: hypothetical protein OXP36_01970 [Gammaproteobacteria bacterium]|nr:hypothetical protein [Gammaproteobacteria bacterium]
MTGDIETDSRAFIAKVKRKAGKFGLRIERVDADAGIVAALGDQLLVVFTEDHDGLVVGLASRQRPEDCFAAEYVAVMLGGIDTKELIAYRNRQEQFVTSVDDAEPPAPLRDTNWLLNWVRENEGELIERFCVQDPKLQLDAIVHSYLAATAGN